MPLEDKSDAQSAVSAQKAVASEGTVPATQTRTDSTPAPALPLDGLPPDPTAKVIVEVRHVSEEIVRVEVEPANGAAEATTPAVPAPPTESAVRRAAESAIRRATREEPTVLQDDRAQREARWKSLETLQPKVAGYELLKKLGQGTYGVVWHAREESTCIEVAIKFFAHGTGDQWQTLQAEVKQLALLHADPGIVQLIDVEAEAVPPYFVMDYAENGSLAKRLESGPLPLDESTRIFKRVVEALAYVHAKGVRHCDLKPGNILLDARGRPKVADFGQAHLSSDASPALGTFFYMAPEQADLTKQIPDTRWDVYGLGALLYAMLTGGPPREDSSVRTQLAATELLAHRLANYRQAVVNAPPAMKHRQVPGMDRALADIINRCLEVEPDKRYHDANAVLEALQRREWNRQQRPILTYGLIVPLILLVLLGYLGYSQARNATETFRAELVGAKQSDCKTAAGLIRSVIKSKLLEQADRVKSAAGGAAVLTAFADRDGLFSDAQRARAAAVLRQETRIDRLDELRDKLKYLGRTFVTWHLTDDEGISLGGDVFVRRKPEETDQQYQLRRNRERLSQAVNYSTDFSFRQWFNGKIDYEDDANHVGEPCHWHDNAKAGVIITRPFISKRENEKDRKVLIGISAPVFLPQPAFTAQPEHVAALLGVAASPQSAACSLAAVGEPKLAGVLVATIEMDEFHDWLAAATMNEGGYAAVFDNQGIRLFHSAFDLERGARPETKATSELPESLKAAIRRAQDRPGMNDRHDAAMRSDNYVDPVLHDGKRYLAGYAPIVNPDSKEFAWIAVVQQDYNKVMDPVDNINYQWMFWGLIKLLAGCLLLLAMWAWLRRKLLRPERIVHA